MTARERVRSTQRALAFVVGSSALFWGCAALFAGLSIAAGINAFVPMSPIVRGALPVVSAIIAIGVLVWVVWRGRFAWTFDRVALWIEEQAPELRYALVTAVDPRYAESAAPLMEPVVSRVDTGAFVRRTATRSMLPSLVALIVTAAIFFMIPGVYKAKPDLNGILNGKPTPVVMGNRLRPLNGTLTPPSYSGFPTERFVNPSTITGLRGSQVVLTGRGTPDGIVVTTTLPPDSANKPPRVVQLPVTAGGDGWRVQFTMTDSVPSFLKLVDRQYSYQLVLDPRTDEAPTARLLSPERDTTLRTITGNLVLRSEFNDDVGLASTEYDFIISSAASEGDIEVREFKMGVRELRGKSASTELVVPYTGYFGVDKNGKPAKLKEGDQISVRAVIRDNNTYNGPGIGYSETRTIRFALKSEYDSLAINGSPPSADTALLSLRMLIIATEKLYKSRPLLERAFYQDSVVALGGTAQSIKSKIESIINDQTGNGEVAVNPLLDTAFNAMQDAIVSFSIAAAGEAIPSLYVAWNALKKYADLAKKYNPRGKLKVELVNIDRVRMAGLDSSGQPLIRKVYPAAVTRKDQLRAQYGNAINLFRSAPDSAVPMLNLMRAEAFRDFPALAKALGDAVGAIEGKKDVSLPLMRVRRELEGAVIVMDTLPPWSGAW